MSSRAEQKQRLKEERLKAEAAEKQAAARKRRAGILGGVVAAAIIVVAIVLVVTNGGTKGEAPTQSANVGLFDGIPQKGVTLGNPDAPIEVEEYLDLQCPVCKAFSENGLDVLVNDYVRTGKVKLTMRPIAIIGDDSVTAAQTALSAGRQNKAWDFAETFYANQEVENSGYVTDSFLDDVAKQTPGLNAQQTLSGRNADAVVQQFNDIAARQQTQGVSSTPSFFATTKGGKPQRLDIQVGDPSSINRVLDPLVN